MSTPTFNESAHPRSRSGKWTAKTVDEAFAGMDALSVSTQGAPTAGGTQTQVGVKESAAAMRHDLRAKFDHPFSVKMSRGTGYGWVHVDWNDGPRATPVTAMTGAYCNKQFDGMDDSYHPVNEDAPVRYGLCGVLHQRNIGPKGQAYLDSLFDEAEISGYQRIEPRTGERSDYDGGYSWSEPMSDQDIHKLEKHLGEFPPPRLTNNCPSIAEVAHFVHARTDFTGEHPLLDLDSY